MFVHNKNINYFLHSRFSSTLAEWLSKCQPVRLLLRYFLSVSLTYLLTHTLRDVIKIEMKKHKKCTTEQAVAESKKNSSSTNDH
jgi:hypothetical protein